MTKRLSLSPRTSAASPAAIKEAIQSLSIPHEKSEVSPVLKVSQGAAFLYPGEEQQHHLKLFELADSALYRAKHQGRDRIELLTRQPVEKLAREAP
ncbi:MAG: diguanylate cyclase [Candidatus Sedimenticola endophacoides]